MCKVSAVVPTWNRADLVRSLLENLQQQTRRLDRVLIVDNGSSDGTPAIARQLAAECIELDRNMGFAAAVNEGIRRADTDWILILNNDVVLRPNWLETMLRTVTTRDAAFGVGKLLQPGGSLDGSWDLVSRGAYAWRCGYRRPNGGVWSEPRTIALAPMTAALFHRRVFERVGLLETRFESYYEDVDFGIRCALAGLAGIYEPSAVATHLGKATLGKQAARVYFLSARNQVLLLAKHYPEQTLKRFAWPILVGQTLALLAAARQGHPISAARGKWQALRQWSDFRKALPPSTDIEQAITRSEREILNLQRTEGFDIYWRIYFSLVDPS
jgi:GT2 family glycosyltransferase